MSELSLTVSPGAAFVPLLSWLNTHHHGFFAAVAGVYDALIGAIVGLLMLAPPPLTVAALAVAVLLAAGWRCSLLCAGGLAACVLLDLWPATVQTLALILLAVLFSVLAGLPLGVLLWRSRIARALATPVLDTMQTLPPWVYLVPAVILFGLGVVPALISTIIYGIPPMIRFTMLALDMVPRNRVDLGHAIGAGSLTILWKIQLPSATPTLLVGINQCVLFSLGMVVLAGLVGAGGLGSEVTRGLSRMDFGLGMRASLAIVVLAVVLDRTFRGAIPRRFLDAP